MRFFVIALLGAAAIGWSAATRSADDYYREAAYAFIGGRFPTAGQICEEGLRKHPGEPRLQALLERIRANKEEQKKKCQNPQDGEGDNKKDSEKSEKDGEKKSSNSSESDPSSQSGTSSQSEGQGNGHSSAAGRSSDSRDPSAGNSSGQGSSSASAQSKPLRAGELSKEQAEQLLREFNQHTGERKPWKPQKGQMPPEKDW